METLLQDAARRAARYLKEIGTRSVAPTAEALERLADLDRPLPQTGLSPEEVLRLLDELASPATVASAGPRYFGFVTGGSLPAALAANWLAGAWDQNAGLYVGSPAAAFLEQLCANWLLDLLGLPQGSGVGFVTGATMANFSGLAAARHALLARAGWDVEARGLFGAPEIKVVVGEEVHASMSKALSLVGFGGQRVFKVPVDGQGRMRPAALPELDDMTLLCLQAGNVNTGAFDPAAQIIPKTQAAGAWVHVDGAFGLWAKASPEKAHLAEALELADSIATDAHKWLNVPYDSGLVFVREAEHLRSAMIATAAYLITTEQREPDQYTPEMSRRARGLEVWAALLSLGRQGLADLIERNCRYALRFAQGLRAAGFEVLNEVVLNQVLVSFGDPETTKKVIAAIQADGTLWAGSTEWQGRTAMRISVSSWATRAEDVERSINAMVRIANKTS